MINLKKIINNKPKLLNVAKVFRQYAIQPAFLLVNLTFNCNSNCPNCYQKFNGFYQSKNGMINPASFERIAVDAKKNFFIKPLIHFFGGEPLINPHFADILSLADQHGFKSSITTNGFLLDKYLAEILKSNLGQINISLDDIGEDHDKARGFPGCFARVIANVDKLLQARRGLTKKKIININCVISENNYDHLFELVNYFMDHDIEINTLTFQHQYSSSGREPGIKVDGLKRQLDEIKKIKAPFFIYFSPNIKLEDLNYFYSNRLEKFKSNCNIPWLGLNILPNLEVTPGGGVWGCNYVVGNLKNESLKNIWNNQKMRNFRIYILDKGLPTACSACCHRQYY